jgi:hypothetical protein
MNNSRSSVKKVSFPSVTMAVLIVLFHPRLFFRSLRCMAIILSKFFLPQYRAVLFPGKIPVSNVEHSLDGLIPFNPAFVTIYLDFVGFWVRIVGFLAIHRKKTGIRMAADFIDSITMLYTFAPKVYSKNLSTTVRPVCNKTFHFRVIHIFDPHLMCIPSLHVMIVIHAYTAFRQFVRELGEEKALQSFTEKVYAGALAITEAILYVKQHSINCIAAALYVMRHFNPILFSAGDAEGFVNRLFAGGAADVPPEYAPFYIGPLVKPEDVPRLREQIISLYRSFVEADAADWPAPLLDFLVSLPVA